MEASKINVSWDDVALRPYTPCVVQVVIIHNDDLQDFIISKYFPYFCMKRYSRQNETNCLVTSITDPKTCVLLPDGILTVIKSSLQLKPSFFGFYNFILAVRGNAFNYIFVSQYFKRRHMYIGKVSRRYFISRK